MPLFAALSPPYCLLPCSANPVELRLYGVFFRPDFLNPDRLRLVGVFFLVQLFRSAGTGFVIGNL